MTKKKQISGAILLFVGTLLVYLACYGFFADFLNEEIRPAYIPYLIMTLLGLILIYLGTLFSHTVTDGLIFSLFIISLIHGAYVTNHIVEIRERRSDLLAEELDTILHGADTILICAGMLLGTLGLLFRKLVSKALRKLSAPARAKIAGLEAEKLSRRGFLIGSSLLIILFVSLQFTSLGLANSMSLVYQKKSGDICQASFCHQDATGSRSYTGDNTRHFCSTHVTNPPDKIVPSYRISVMLLTFLFSFFFIGGLIIGFLTFIDAMTDKKASGELPLLAFQILMAFVPLSTLFPWFGIYM